MEFSLNISLTERISTVNVSFFIFLVRSVTKDYYFRCSLFFRRPDLGRTSAISSYAPPLVATPFGRYLAT
ncbi:unnamed protein product [Rhizophagus irregularis]|nr:unnamed protein product [Rhizophagus irregularis]